MARRRSSRRLVFIDTSHLVALLNRRDQHYARAIEVGNRLGRVALVTTELVLVELLNYFAGFGPLARAAAVRRCRQLLGADDVEVVYHDHDAFLRGLEMYESRRDKEYSLVDCISTRIMTERGIEEVLTHDHHFAQEGFTLLL